VEGLPLTTQGSAARVPGDVAALRYITTDGRIEICWPCRVVVDREDVIALSLQGTLRLMFPGQCHSVSLFWGTETGRRRLLKYFVNMEEPLRRTAVGFDTQDHTLDIECTPELAWRWRDEQELANHVAEGFYTDALAAAARAEGGRAIAAMRRGEHECMRGWSEWRPPPEWRIPPFIESWDTTPATVWERRAWAYGAADVVPQSREAEHI
jgi:hypothetical protein